MCFITNLSLEAFLDHLAALEIKILQSPVERTGAVGKIRSVYFRDPDGNLLEVSTYEIN